MSRLGMLNVFVSHATIDADLFKIREIKKSLEAHPKIQKVAYWEEDAISSIQGFMGEGIKKCDLFILLCSDNAIKSNAVKNEYEVANQLHKPIIPIFTNESHIPTMLICYRGVKFEVNNYKQSINQLIKIIEGKIENKEFIKKDTEVSPAKNTYLKSMIRYRGVPLLKRQLEVLVMIETELGKTIQFSAEDGFITNLGVRFKELTTIPKELQLQLQEFKLPKLKRLNYSGVAMQLQMIKKYGKEIKIHFKNYELIPKEKVLKEMFYRHIYLAPEEDDNFLTIYWNIPTAGEFGNVIEFDIDEATMDIYANYILPNYNYRLLILKSSLPPKDTWRWVNYSKDMLILKRSHLEPTTDPSSLPNIFHGGSIKSGGLFQWSYVDTSNLIAELVGQFWVDNEESARTYAEYNNGNVYKLTNSNVRYLLNKKIIEIFKFYNPWSENLYDKNLGKAFYNREKENLEYVILPKNFEAYETFLGADLSERERIKSFTDALS
ncbi:MAG: toll/interleukin-1 receptor domain-containing protein [Candidatus Odinarchaeota archaeon]